MAIGAFERAVDRYVGGVPRAGDRGAQVDPADRPTREAIATRLAELCGGGAARICSEGAAAGRRAEGRAARCGGARRIVPGAKRDLLPDGSRAA